jgi:anti-anti-sigma factor
MHDPATTYLLKWTGDANIYAASELCQSVNAALQQRLPIEVDLAEVSEIDSVGVQQLLLLRRECRHAGLAMQLGALSPAAAEVLNLLNLQPQLQA